MTIAVGGETDEADSYIAPTVLVDVKGDDKIMVHEVRTDGGGGRREGGGCTLGICCS